jgi:dTDP-glucose 4,6-dehydratase
MTQIASGMKEIRLGSLEPTRDFSFVMDTVRGFIAVAESDRSVGEVINVGSNFEVSIGDTAAHIAEVMGAEVAIKADDERIRPENSEVERLFAGIDKARDLAGWTPEYGGLEGFKRGLAETAAWFADPDNLSFYKADRYNI